MACNLCTPGDRGGAPRGPRRVAGRSRDIHKIPRKETSEEADPVTDERTTLHTPDVPALRTRSGPAMSGGDARPYGPVGERLALAVEIAREAGEATLEHFGAAELQVERKGDDTPVTEADRAAEELLRARIRSAFPGDAILGEEFGEAEGSSGFRWVLDPIDGTRSFVHGVPLYGTLVGLQRDGRTVAGVIRMPALDEGVHAARGHGAWHVVGGGEPVPARVSRTSDLREALFLTTEVGTWHERGAGDAFDLLRGRAALTRTWGDCYGYLLVATGRAEVMVDPVMSVWDAAALLPVLEEAGGSFPAWAGRGRPDGGEGVATSGRLADEVLAVLRPWAEDG